MTISFVDYLEPMFNRDSVVDMYAVVESARRTLGFHTPNDNNMIMDQARYVTQQFRKTQEKLHGPLINVAKDSSPLEVLQALVDNKLELDSYPGNEKEALYNCVRDTWLNSMIARVQYWIASDGNVETKGLEYSTGE